jgi:porin
VLRPALIAGSIFYCGECLAQTAGDPHSASEPAWTDTVYPLPQALRQLTDWNKTRTRLEQAGVKFTFGYYGDAFANPVGGVKQGLGYDGRFVAIVDADLEKLVGWSGAVFHTSVQQIHGTEFSAENVDNLMNVGGVEAPPSTSLFNLWIEQSYGKQVNVRLGQFTAAQEFLVSENADLFVNSTFGWPVLTAEDLPSGGASYPEATPGARVQITPTDAVTLRAAIFDGDPAGPGPGNPVARNPYGVAFRVTDPPFLIAELAYAYGQPEPADEAEDSNQEGDSAAATAHHPTASKNLPGTVKIGAWLHTGTFPDEELNAFGMSLAAGGAPLEHQGDFAVYGILDQMVWRPQSDDDRGISIFARGTAAPSDRNLIDFYADAGVTYKGPLASRSGDTLGLAFAYGHISPAASALDEQTITLTGTPMPIRDFEAAIELTYQWKLADNWFIQPDVQFIVHPGGNIADPLAPMTASPIPNALVIGTRTTLRF